MAHVDGRADRAFAGIEISPNRVEGGVFHDHDHHGSGEHRRQDRVLEPVREMLGLDEEVEGALGPKGYLFHGLPSKGGGDEPELSLPRPPSSMVLFGHSFEAPTEDHRAGQAARAQAGMKQGKL
jgi:hypothetical protein